MRKTLMLAGAAALAVMLWLPRAVEAKCADCEKGKGKMHSSCPCKVKGAEKTVTNTPEGVTITITAKDPAAVKEIQEAAAKMKDGACAKCTGKAGCDCPKCKHGAGCDCPKCKHKGEKKEAKKEEKKP